MSEGSAVSFADGCSRARDPCAASDGVLSAGGGVGESAAAFLALVADEHALCLRGAGSLVDDVTTEFGAGGINDFAAHLRSAVGEGNIAAALLAGSGPVLTHDVGGASLSGGDAGAGFLTDLVGGRPHASGITVAGRLRGVAEGAFLDALVGGIDHALVVGDAGSQRCLESALAVAHVAGFVPLADGDVQAANTVGLLVAGSRADATGIIEGALVIGVAAGLIGAVHLEASLAALLVGRVVGTHVGFESAFLSGELIARSFASLSGLVPHALIGDRSATCLIGPFLDARSGASGSDEETVGIVLAGGDGFADASLLALAFVGRPEATTSGISVAGGGVGVLSAAGLDAASVGFAPAADRVGSATVDVEEFVAGRVAHGAIDGPSAGALRSILASGLAGVAELALGSASTVDHLAHGLIEAVSGVGLVAGTRVNALLLGGVPHAACVGVAAASGGVGRAALGTTGRGD